MPSKKQIILKAAAVLFAHKGYTETAMAELARLAGVAEGTLFYHFKTKEDLFTAVLGTVKDGILEDFDSYMSQCRFENGMEMVEQVVAFFLYLAGHHEEWMLLLQRHYIYDLAETNDGCRLHLETIFNTLTDLFEGAIVKGKQDGSIGDTDSRKKAILLLSMVNGLLGLKFHNLYEAGLLHQELLTACRRILTPDG